MKKTTLKRVCAMFAQHLLGVGILIAVAVLVLNSYVEVSSIDGTKIYKIFPIDSKQEFEESEIYQDLFRNAVSDITQLVVIKSQFETDGVFDPSKRIDVTEYAGKLGADKGCAVSCAYNLDDMIKWGRYGVNYNRRIMTRHEFVNYFGKCIYPENFKIDEYGQLAFDGFYRVGNGPDTGLSEVDEDGNSFPGARFGDYGKSFETVLQVKDKMERSGYTEARFEDMVFSYIMSCNIPELEISGDDKKASVVVPIMNCRYNTIEGDSKLDPLVNNWVDFMYLQENIEKTIETIVVDYQRYQVCNRAYSELFSNVKYVVRMIDENGQYTYGNMSAFNNESTDEEITELFSEFRRYLIYYPESLVFMGNTILNEEEFYKYLSRYEYAYPENTHIWMGVDTNYPVVGDAFYNADNVYEKIVPKVWTVIGTLGVLLLLWVTIGIALTITEGTRVGENGEVITSLRYYDKNFTEILLLLAAGFGYLGYRWYQYLIGIAEKASISTNTLGDIYLSRLYQYGSFGLFGFYLSFAIGIIWYSFVRRARCHTLWTGSLFYWLGNRIAYVTRFVFRHKNATISVLLPFNLYIFINFAGLIAFYLLQDKKILAVLILICVVLFNGFVCAILFKQHAERNTIIDGINRIRDGEVDYVLNSESLHGTNRDLADAVNNIGEGIRKAVKTSMKDEQMKTDLITNVSHDIKTPLTSIINYIDLLRRLKIEEEPAKGYISILDNKARRLKQLTDDLVEASKISSGNIILNKEKLNITELINQGIGEFDEKLEERGLKVVFEKSNVAAYIFADSRRMWRILENLLNNICKYAMENTRVYFDLELSEDTVEVSVKNISRQQMNIKPEELTERFIRGDSARSTEGSGLGLSIAKSLTQVQGGEFIIYLDGDLFKVTLKFPKYVEPAKEVIKENELGLVVEEDKK